VKIRCTLADLETTGILGRCLGEMLSLGDVVLLKGDLGAGKTMLTKAVAASLGVDEREVTSPSFAIVHEHLQGRLPLVHADLYRLGQGADLSETGMEEYLLGDHLVLIEWAEYMGDDRPWEALTVLLEWKNGRRRDVVIQGQEVRWKERLRRLGACLGEAGIPVTEEQETSEGTGP
jgi:tRNA threonylcarbamoyladenosine biosynthesis protein TsaE